MLAGCDRGPPPPEENALDAGANVVVDVPPENVVEPVPVVNAMNNATPAPPPKISNDVQMRDDADATGMTSRLPDDESTLPGQQDNQSRPAEQ
jgi:hypothetical protein